MEKNNKKIKYKILTSVRYRLRILILKVSQQFG